MRSLILMVGFFTGISHAGYRFTKRVNLGPLQEELKKAGFNVDYIQCDGKHNCELVWRPGGEKKDPKPIIDAHVYVSPEARRAQREAEIKALKVLAAKWTAGTITAVEKDELIRRFILLYLGE